MSATTLAAAAPQPSPLMLCDHLLTLARQAEQAGYPGTATRLVGLAESMFRERPRRLRPQTDRRRPKVPRQSS